MFFSTKKIQSTAFLSFFSVICLYLLYFIADKYSLVEFENPILIFWVGFSFLTGLLQVTSKNIFPFTLAITSDKIKTRTRRIIFFSLGVVLSLFTIGYLLGYFGDFLKSINLNLNSYFYIIFGFITFLVTLSGLRLVNFNDSRKIPNIFNNSASLFNLFIIGFCSSFIDIIPALAIISAKVLSVGMIGFGVLIFTSNAFGRIIPLIFIDISNRYNSKIIEIITKIKSKINYINNLLLLILATAFIHIGLINFIEIKNIKTGYFVHEFIYNGWLLLFLWLIPLWIKYFYEENRIYKSSLKEFKLITQKIKELESECDDLKFLYKFNDKVLEKRISELKKKLVQLSYDGRIIESCLRHSAKYPIRSFTDQAREERWLKQRLIFTVFITIIAVLFISVLNI